MSPKRKARLTRTLLLVGLTAIYAWEASTGIVWLWARVAWQVALNVLWMGN